MLRILVIGYTGDISTKIFVGNFKTTLPENVDIEFVPACSCNMISLQATDILVFSRTFDHLSLLLQQKASQMKVPVIYMLDDDLLGLYENEHFKVFSPGTVIYNTILKQISSADLVITYSTITEEVVKAFNPRVVTFKTHILSKYLNDTTARSSRENPLRFIYAGTPTKQDEFLYLWPAFQKISQDKRENIEFHFWGLNVNTFVPLHSPVYMEPFTFDYESYINKLKCAQFDVMISPLFDKIRAQKAKCPIKYLEATAAGCIGIYSDVFPYLDIKKHQTGIKTENTIDGWHQSFRAVCDMDTETRNHIWQAAREHLLSEYTTEAQMPALMNALNEAKMYALRR